MPIARNSVFILFSLIFSACNIKYQTWQYAPSSYEESATSPRTKRVAKKLAVLVFEERLNDMGVSENNLMLATLPFIPYATAHTSSPGAGIRSMFHDKPEGQCVRQTERGEMMFFNPPVSFSYALSKEIEEARIFKNIEYVCGMKDKSSDVDYVVKGIIRDESFDVALYTYGLGFINFVVPIPWLFGAPVDSRQMRLAVDLELIDVKKDVVILKKSYKKESKKIYSGLYYGDHKLEYPAMASEIFKEFTAEIRTVIK